MASKSNNKKATAPKSRTALDQIKEWYYSSLIICFTGILVCYSGYAYL
jgi:hypothetical protein